VLTKSRALRTEPERKNRGSQGYNKRTGLRTGHYDGKPDWLLEGSRYNCQSGGQGPAY
jgi:hypothetical protein